MACIITYENKQYTQKEFEQYFKEHFTEFVNNFLGSKQDIRGFKNFVQNRQSFDKRLAQKIQDKLQKLYPEIKLNITNNPIWEQGDNVLNQEEYNNQVNYRLKATEILLSDKAKQVFEKGKKNNWSLDKILTELAIPKEQKQLILDLGITDREQIALELTSNFSYTVEINTAKAGFISNEYDELTDTFVDRDYGTINTQLHSDLTVNEDFYKNNPDWEYRIQQIVTPNITPSIQNHNFNSKEDSNKIGWFRAWYNKKTGEVHVLEVQSDLFQKWRNNFEFEGNKYTAKKDYKNVWHYYRNNNEINANEYTKTWETFLDTYLDNADAFIKLLQKGNNWVTFFIKSIIQDSAKKGYEKVWLPTGNTASKIEGHATLEEFKGQKEDKIKELEGRGGEWFIEDKYANRLAYFKTKEEADANVNKQSGENVGKESINNEINQLKQELERVEREGFGALKPIYNFYENTVANILKKQGLNPILITDEYGNKWNEITINQARDLQNILLQKDEANRIIGQANVKAGTVLIDAINQKQDTLPHEYAHHYIAWNRNSPIVKEAIKKWGSEEALVQSIGEQAVRQKGEAWTWWKKFVKWLLGDLNKLSTLKKEELTNILTDAFLTRQVVPINPNMVNDSEIQYSKVGSKQDNVSLSPTPIAPRIDNLQAATEAEISRLRQENSRLKQAANNINPDSVDADIQLAELFRRQQNLQNRIDTLIYRKEAYKNYDFDMLEDIFNTDLARLQYLMEDTLDLQEKLRNIKEAQRIVDYYSEIGDFSREENFLFDDTASVPDGIRLFFQNFANTVEPYNAKIAEIQKKIIVDLTKSVPTIEKWLEDKQIELSYEFLTKPVKDKDWLSMQVLSSEDNYASDQILIIDVLMTMAREYEDAAIKQRRDIIEKLDAKIKAIIGKHNNYDVFKQLDENGEFTGDIIMPFAQKYFNARKEAKSAKYAKLRELRQKPSLSAAEVKLAKKLSKEIKQWELENELMLDPRKLPEIKDAFPDLVREFDVNISDADRAAYKANVLTHLNQKGYDSYVSKVNQHIKEYRLLENYMQEWADDNLAEFVQSLNLKPGINVNNSVEAMRIWKALHSPFYALIDHNTVLPLTIEVDGQMRTLSEISNIKDSHYRFTEVVPRRNKGIVTNVNNVYTVQNTAIDTGFYDSKFAAIENDASLYDFWYFAIHNLSLAKQMMPYRFQQGYQINSILYMEKGVMEQITSDGAFSTVYSRAWDGLVKSLTDNDLSTESYEEDPFGGRERNINYNFLGTRQQLEDKLYEKKLIEYFVKNKINATSVQEARSKGLLTPTINKALADLRKEAKREIAEKASFDLGSVLKFYLGTMVALNHKENILPVLNNIEATIGTIRKAQTNRQGKTMTEKGALKATDLPIVNAIDRVAYQLDVYTGQPTQMIEGTSSKTMLNKEETEIVKNLEALKAEATEEQKVAIQKLIDSYGSKLTGSGTMDTVLAYLRFRGLGWNVSAQVANWSAGYFANFTAAADGRVVKASALQRAYNIFWHLVMPSFVKSKVNQETSNKIKNLMYKGDFLLDATSEMQKSRFKSDSTLASKLDWLSPYMPTRLTEYMNQGTLVVGRLMTVKVPKNDGTMATLFDALDENLNIKPEFSNIAEDYNWNTGELMAKETTLIRNLIQNVHGDYSEIGRQYAKRKIAGRMAMFFKTWLPNAMKVRFGAEKFDPVYNMETKGRYRSYTPGTAALTGATLGTWFAPGLGTAIGYGIGMGVAKLWGNDIHEKNIVEDFKDSFTGLGMLMKRLVYSKLRHFNPAFADKLDTQFGNFSDVDAANLRANFQELQFMLTLLLTYLVAKAVLFDDDEDKKNQLVHNYLINQIVKVQGDLMFYTSPQTPGTLMEQLIPVSKLVNQSFGLINSANKAIYNVELQPNEDTFGENFGELFPSPIPSTKVFERVFNEPALLKKLYE